LANDVHSDAAGPDVFEISAAYALWIARAPIVTQNKAHAIAQTFHFEPYRLSIVTVSVADDVSACLIQA
jgi:hypothetical protein